jgi:epoxide hydrolase
MNINRRDALASMLRVAGALSLADMASPGSLQGAATRSSDMMQPFEIDFGTALIDDLHRRIDQTRWPEIPFATGWNAGTDENVLRDLVAYWRRDYDWFRVQGELNRLNHLRGPIAGEQLHCVVYTGARPGPRRALLLLHGWPSSFHEFHQAAELLSSGDTGEAFDIVVPSLPGFVFSQAPREPGMTPGRIAERLHLLMGELGYSRYGVQGGDWGAIIGTEMARAFPQALIGLHLNFVASAPQLPAGEPISAAERTYRENRARFQAEETGYSAIQGTRPQSLAFSQQDSPVGWLAWVVEKYWAWGDHRGDLWSTFRRDDLITTAMLYWLPNRILSAARLYFETSSRPQTPAAARRVEVPTGYARFPAEPWGPPPEVVARTYNLVHISEHSRGGHFPALEQPRPWAADVAGFFGSLT